MSGSVSAAFSAGFALAGLLIGGGGDVSLGSFVADWLETPEKMPFGGAQRVVVHKLLGGARVIDLLGADEADISFSGYFFGPFAQARAQVLDTMRQQGQVVPLVWPGDSRNVVITDFKCSYESGGGMLPYSVTCMVIPNVAPPSAPTLTSQVNSDANSAIGVPDAASTGSQSDAVIHQDALQLSLDQASGASDAQLHQDALQLSLDQAAPPR